MCHSPKLASARSGVRNARHFAKLVLHASIAGAVALTLAGCKPSPAELAERRYEIVKKQGDSDATCAAAREVEAAYLDSLNQERYRWWSSVAGIACNRALLDKLS